MKKVLCFVLIALIALGGISLGEKQTRIVFWHSATGDAGELLGRYVDEFNVGPGAQLGVYVEAVYQGSYSDSASKLQSLLSAENEEDLPDVMQLDATGKVRYLSAKSAYTLDEALSDHPDEDTGDFLAPALENWRLNGVQLGLPFATSTTLTYYNASVLDEAPDSLYDLMDIADEYELEDGVCVYACVPNTPTLANWLGQMGSRLVNGNNGSEQNATELDCLEDGSLLRFLEIWKELYASGALVSRASSNDEFIAGKQLVMTASSSMISTLEERIGGAFELGVSPYLRVSPDDGYGATVSGSCLVMFKHDDERSEAAWEFVKYMTSDLVQAGFAMGTGYIPSRVSAVKTDLWQDFICEAPEYNVGFEQLMLTPEGMRSVTVGPAADFYYTIQDVFTSMLEEDTSPEEALETLEEELNGLLTQYARANP